MVEDTPSRKHREVLLKAIKEYSQQMKETKSRSVQEVIFHLHRKNTEQDGECLGYTDIGYTVLDSWCVECSDQSGREYGVPWPCNTWLAVVDRDEANSYTSESGVGSAGHLQAIKPFQATVNQSKQNCHPAHRPHPQGHSHPDREESEMSTIKPEIIDKAAEAGLNFQRAANGLRTPISLNDIRATDATLWRDEYRAALTAVAADLRAEAWDEGHRTPQQREMDDCYCHAYYAGECACGRFGTGRIITPNPYRRDNTND